MNKKRIIPGFLLVFLLPFLYYFSSCSSTHGGTGGSVRDTTSVSRKAAAANGTGGSVRDTTSAKMKN